MKRPTATNLLSHPFAQKGLKKEETIKYLVRECVPLLAAAREKKKNEGQKDGESEEEGDIKSIIKKPGTRITINSSSGNWSSSSRGTTVLNQDSIYGGTVEIKTDGEEEK